MKAILEFNLDEPDEQLKFDQANKGGIAILTLFSIREKIRLKYKHISLSNAEYKVIEEIREIIAEALDNSNLNLNELIQ